MKHGRVRIKMGKVGILSTTKWVWFDVCCFFDIFFLYIFLGIRSHLIFYSFIQGLGTSTAADAKKYFSAMDRHMKPFKACEPEDSQLVDMAFNKKRADDRKDWLSTYRVRMISFVSLFFPTFYIFFHFSFNVPFLPCFFNTSMVSLLYLYL